MSPATGALGGPRILVFTAVFLSILSLVTHLTGIGLFGAVLFPLALVFIGFNPAAFLLVSLAGFIIFFEAFSHASNIGPLNTPDLVLAAFMIHALLARRTLTFTVPVSGLLITLYAFLLYALARSIGPAMTVGPFDNWLFRDVKCLFYLGMAAYICRSKYLGPKNLTLLLLAIVCMTAVHGAICIFESIRTGTRAITWNEIYMADGVVLAVVLLSIPQLRSWNRLLITSLVITVLSLLVTETRGIWIATTASLFLYGAIALLVSDRARIARIRKNVAIAAMVAAVVIGFLKVAMNFSVIGKITGRLGQGSVVELADPYSSMGYRLHESYVVWENRTWLGHGSGAGLHLFFTQLGKSQVMDWWGIHSEYFEVLHKYGFIGLGLFLVFLGMLAWRAMRIAMSPKILDRSMGLAVLLCLSNHAVASITSGYLIREHVMIFLLLLIVITERFHPAAARSRRLSKSRIRAAHHPMPAAEGI